MGCLFLLTGDIHERLIAAQHKDGYHDRHTFAYILGCEALSSDDVGVARSTTFRDQPPGDGVNTGDFVEKMIDETS